MMLQLPKEEDFFTIISKGSAIELLIKQTFLQLQLKYDSQKLGKYNRVLYIDRF